ncbi:MAG TPA: iron uptake system protein EfeO [Roseiarcus sp.]|jgi:iron uptake system component EfeO
MSYGRISWSKLARFSGAAFLCHPATIGGQALGQATAAPIASGPILITLTDAGCEPAKVDAIAGKTTFNIKNESRHAVEWEILKDVMVVEERENILPGFAQTLTATLDAGDYAMTCGLRSNPKGVLTVAATNDPPAKPSPMDLVGPIAEYKVYVKGEVEVLVAETKKLTDAVKAGKLADAQRLYAPAHQHYERIEPIAELFNDLDGSMDSREDDFEKKAEDPKFLGFHRLEKGLFTDKSTEGLAPIADKLMADALDLQKRVDGLTIAPKDLVGGAADLIEEVASKKITGEEDRYSRTDLWDFQANVDGAQKIVALLNPLIVKQDPKLSARLNDNFSKVDVLLAKYRTKDGGFESYEKLSDHDRTALKAPVTTLAEDLSALKGALGVE